MRKIGTLIHKELLDIVRDKRTIISMIVMPLVVIPLLLYVVSFVAYTKQKQIKEEVYQVALNKEASQKKLLHLLSQNGLKPYISENPEEDIRNKKAIAGLLYDTTQRRYTILMDASREKSQEAGTRCEKALLSLKEEMIYTNLASRNIDPNLIKPFEISKLNIAPARKMAGLFMGVILGYLLVIMIFSGATYPAIDLTAGEKERRTIEILLSSPATRFEIAISKLVAVAVVAILSSFLYIVSYSFAMLTITKSFLKDPSLSLVVKSLPFDFKVISLLILSLIPFSIFAASLEVAIASFAKSYKEAQSYLTPLILIIIFPAILGMISADTQVDIRNFFIPIFNMTQIIKLIMIGEVSTAPFLITFISNIVYAVIGVVITLRIFARGDVLLRG